MTHKDDSRPWLQPVEPDFDLKSLKFCAIFSVETTGGTDKVLTIIEKLPKNESFLKTLVKKLNLDSRFKASYRMDRKEGVIEVFGDKRIMIREFFTQEGFEFIG